jgi:hypothetical protein
VERRKSLRIDLEELCSAMEDTAYEHRYYLDLETGEIIFFSDDDDSETGELKNRIYNEPDVFEAIPRIESYQAYSDMEDFIASVKDENMAGLLNVAIEGKGAFRRFKDGLLDYPEERENWFRFKDARMRDRAAKWLDEIGVNLSVP